MILSQRRHVLESKAIQTRRTQQPEITVQPLNADHAFPRIHASEFGPLFNVIPTDTIVEMVDTVRSFSSEVKWL